MEENKSYKLIVRDILKAEGKTIKDLADLLAPDGLSYRTVYAYLGRKHISLEIAAKMAHRMNRTLDEIFVPIDGDSEDLGIEEADEPTESNIPSVQENAEDRTEQVLMALVDFDNFDELKDAACKLGVKGMFDLAKICEMRSEEIKKLEEGSDGKDGG